MSVMNAEAFDALTLAGALDHITQSIDQKITNLKVGDILKFVDNYGKNGQIKTTAIKAGFGNDDFIEFSIKIQPLERRAYIKQPLTLNYEKASTLVEAFFGRKSATLFFKTLLCVKNVNQANQFAQMVFMY